MIKHHRRGVGIAAAAALIVATAPFASAQPWRPDKAVEIVTSSAAGGSNDRVARMIQKIIQDEKLIPTPVSVLNKPGGNQTLSRA